MLAGEVGEVGVEAGGQAGGVVQVCGECGSAEFAGQSILGRRVAQERRDAGE